MIRIAVCSSAERDRAALCGLLNRRMCEMSVDAAIDPFQSGAALLAELRADEYAMVFLDTDLVDMRGLKAAKQLRANGYTRPILFVSESRKDVLKSYSVHAAGYFIKPVAYGELCSLLRRHRSAILSGMRTLQVVFERAERSICLADILYIQVSGRTSQCCTRKGAIPTNRALSELEAQLAGEPFLRCHRSYLVNAGHIASFDGQTLTMDNGDALPVGSKRAKAIEQALSQTRAPDNA